MMMMSSTASGAAAGPQTLPDLSGAVAWLNSPPLNRDQLKGHVVVVDFWTYSCINCLRRFLTYARGPRNIKRAAWLSSVSTRRSSPSKRTSTT